MGLLLFFDVRVAQLSYWFLVTEMLLENIVQEYAAVLCVYVFTHDWSLGRWIRRARGSEGAPREVGLSQEVAMGG